MRVPATVALLAIGSLCVMPAWSQERNGPDGNQGNLSRVLSNPGVHEELKLTTEQVRQAQAASANVVEKHRQDFTDALASTDRRLSFRKVFLAVTEETVLALEPILSEAQLRRLKQIELQAFGARALLRPNVLDALHPTSKQLSTFEALGESFGKQLHDIGANREISAADKDLKRKQLRSEFAAELQPHLSPEQWKVWNELLGPPFVDPPLKN